MPRPVASTLVGRGVEWSHLAAAAARARDGVTSVALVCGEAGIGKSRLVADWTATARADGAVVALGRCIEVEGASLPLAPVVGLLRDLVRQLGSTTVRTAAGAHAAALGSLLPELATHGPAAPQPATNVQTFDAVAAVVRSLGDEALLVLTVEDLHWSDALTRDLLGYLARASDTEHLIVVLTTRPEVPEPVDRFLAELVRLPGTDRIDVTRLDRGATAALVEQLGTRSLRPAERDRLLQLSDGVPFLVEELVAAVIEATGPVPGVPGQLMLRRWSRLGPGARQVVAAASLADAELTDLLLRACVAEELPHPDAALHEAIEVGVLEPAPDRGGYRFRHALLREAVAARLLPGEAEVWHGRWARALEATQSGLDPLTRSVALAQHWDAAGNAAPALSACIAAAEQCRLRTAYVEQSRLLRRAVRRWDEIGDPTVLTGISRESLIESTVDATVAAGASADVIRLARDEMGATAESDLLGRGRWRILIAEQQAELDRTSVTLDLPDLRELVTLVLDAPPSRTKVWAAHSLCEVVADPDVALEMAQQALEAATQLGDDTLTLRMRAARAYVFGWLGKIDEAIAEHTALMPLIDQFDSSRLSLFLVSTVSLNSDTGRLQAALKAAEQARLSLGDEQQAPLAWAQLTAFSATALIDLGRWDEAHRSLETSRSRYVAADWPWLPGLLALICLWRGDLDKGERLAESAQLDPHGPIGIWDFGGWIRVTIAAARRDIGAIRGEVEAMLTRVDIRTAADALRLLLAATTAEADEAARARAAGDTAALDPSNRAVTIVRDVLSRIEWPGPGPDAQRLHIAAELDRWAGQTDPVPWQAVVNAYTPIGYPHERGWALLHLAETLVESDRRDDAARAVQEATETAERLGARPLADELAALARRARLPAAPTPPANLGSGIPADALGLTERERQVLALLCDGLTNPAIGKRLYMSPKTASVHVSRILTKLGATNRTQAATVAHRLGLDGPRP